MFLVSMPTNSSGRTPGQSCARRSLASRACWLFLACGPAAAAYLASPLGVDNLITIDMGGTSLDVCLIRDGEPCTALETAVAGVYHLKLPLIDVHTIGAGGGSIAWLDKMNVLHVGPQSAGAEPGPVCYGKGGTEPTSTDADLVLGYLNPEYFLGGEMRVDVELARKAIKEKIADPLGDVHRRHHGISF